VGGLKAVPGPCPANLRGNSAHPTLKINFISQKRIE